VGEPPGLTAVDAWTALPSDAPDLFSRLRELGPLRACVRFGVGLGEGLHVEIPAARLMVEGLLHAEPQVDRFGIEVPGWGAGDFAWFARRRGRGGPDYWQGAIEHRPEGRPALVLYFTAPLDGLEIRVLETAEGAG
jgi:hypothetical protein